MSARREFHCQPCRKGNCDDCVRLLWQGEGCVHECYNGRQLSLFPLDQEASGVREVPGPVREPDDVLDW